MLAEDEDTCGSQGNQTGWTVRIASQGFRAVIAHPRFAAWLYIFHLIGSSLHLHTVYGYSNNAYVITRS